ncbi:hypothetical protein GCM10023191_043300 [Actinoallomurus oryzae]|uniref:Uncharacterized protein n=1 Tax=Actinoallomurus oryzae TaxID=502180 RepID=A0ABP8Q601_9ACTN
MPEPGRRPRLALHPGVPDTALALTDVVRETEFLDGHQAVEVGVSRPPHRAYSAPAERPEDVVPVRQHHSDTLVHIRKIASGGHGPPDAFPGPSQRPPPQGGDGP